MATSAWARAITPEQKMQRSREIAERDHLMYRARYLRTNEYGEAVFMVPSRTQAYRQHAVRRTPTGEWSCTCEAAQWGNPCGHVGAAAHCWQQVEQAMTAAAAEANRRYHEFAEWLETQGY